VKEEKSISELLNGSQSEFYHEIMKKIEEGLKIKMEGGRLFKEGNYVSAKDCYIKV
jgi:hypothetical protein